MTVSNSLTTNPLLAVSYSLQRNDSNYQSSIISLLVSAASTDLPPRSPDYQEAWGVVTACETVADSISILQEALDLASVDNLDRQIFNSRGEVVYDKNNVSVPPTTVTNTLPLIAQIADLKHFSLGKKRDEAKEKDTSPQLIHKESRSQKETRPIDADLLSSTLELDENIQKSIKEESLTKLNSHLLIICDQAFESITPSILPKDTRNFKSVTVLYIGSSDHVLSWLRWSAQIGGSLILKNEDTVSLLADRFQTVSRKLGRQALHFIAGSGFSILSVTQLTPMPGPIPVENVDRVAQEITLWANQPSDDLRWSTMITFKKVAPSTSQPTLTFAERGQRLLTLYINEHAYPIMIPHSPMVSAEHRRSESRAITLAISNPLNGKLLPRLDGNLLGVAFAQQLCHRVRVIDNLVLSLLRREARKSAKLLDQLLKITSTLESSEQVEVIRLLKIQLLATGQLKRSSKNFIVDLMTKSTHQLSIDGVWQVKK
jgi:hypothetical protein